MFIFMWCEKVELGNNLLIKSNKGGELIIDYNQQSDCLFQICINWGIRFRILVIVSEELSGGCLRKITCHKIYRLTMSQGLHLRQEGKTQKLLFLFSLQHLSIPFF